MAEDTAAAPPREEYVGDEPTDVEVETQDDEDGQEEIRNPWKPDQIRVTTKQFSLRNILDLIDEKELELAPDFQRNRVWKPWQKSRLIESILLQIPLPAFYFAEDSDGMMRVVDGLQRLSTVHAFVRGEPKEKFRLKGLEYLDADGQRFDELPAPWRRRLNNTQIVVHVIDPTTPSPVKYDIFKRINTLGTPLSSQEIRHCMSKDRSRDFLKRCTRTGGAFDKVTGGKVRDHLRMHDREMVLRFCAFELLGEEAYYKEYRAMDPFLDAATARLDDPAAVPDSRLEDLFLRLGLSMLGNSTVFENRAFRKWLGDETRISPINRALFESWSVTLAEYDLADLLARRDQIVRHSRDLMTHDVQFVAAITSSTGDPRKVKYRFDRTREAAEAGR